MHQLACAYTVPGFLLRADSKARCKHHSELAKAMCGPWDAALQPHTLYGRERKEAEALGRESWLAGSLQSAKPIWPVSPAQRSWEQTAAHDSTDAICSPTLLAQCYCDGGPLSPTTQARCRQQNPALSTVFALGVLENSYTFAFP